MKINSSKIILGVLLLAVLAMMLSAAPAAAGTCRVSAGIQSQNSLTVPELTNGTLTLVTLNGENSKQNATSFVWAQTGGPPVQLSYEYDNNTNLPVKAKFTVPAVGPGGTTLTFRLTVSGCGTPPTQTSTAEITVNVMNDVANDNRPPVAVATANPNTVKENMQFTLDGSGSTDPDGNTLSYSWSQVLDDGTLYWLSNNVTETYTAPEVPYPAGATLTFKLTVSDGYLSSSANTTVTVKWVNDPPVAIVSCPTLVNERASVTLDGSSSTDDEDGIVTYAWSQLVGLPNANLPDDLSLSTLTFTAPDLTSSLNKMKFGLTVTDKGGLSNSADCDITVMDITPPDIECSGPDQTVWYGDNVTVTCTASDAASGLADANDASFSLSTHVSTDTEVANAETDSKSICDTKGNCADAGPYEFKVDRKAPSVSCGSGDDAWHPDNVSISCTANDGGSGLKNAGDASFSLTTNVPIGEETANAATDSRSVCDSVGHCATAGPISGNKVDKKAPSISASATKADNSNYTAGTWTNQTVTVHFVCIDGGSGVKSCGPDATLSADGETASVAGAAVDIVGNAGSATFGPVRIDKTPPTITFVSRTPANENGWNNSDVTVTWSCSDSLSGVVSGTVTKTVSTEGSSQSATGTCTDQAGNTASDTQSGINIDKTKPTLSPSVSPNPVLLNGSATATAGATDSLSGIDTQNCDTLVTNSVGSKSVTCTATDKAGNTATQTVAYSVRYASSGMCLGDAGHQILQPVNADGTSVFKWKSTVPAKFRVCDANGASIGTPGVVSSFRIVQTLNGTAVATVDEAVDSTTPDAAFRWSATDQQWIFNMNTRSLYVGYTYYYLITLNDGTSIPFHFGLR